MPPFDAQPVPTDPPGRLALLQRLQHALHLAAPEEVHPHMSQLMATLTTCMMDEHHAVCLQAMVVLATLFTTAGSSAIPYAGAGHLQVLQTQQAPLTTWSTLVPRWQHLAKHDTHAAVRARALAALATAACIADQQQQQQQQQPKHSAPPPTPHPPPPRPAAGSSSDSSAESWLQAPATPSRPPLHGQPSITSSGVASTSESEGTDPTHAALDHHEGDGACYYSDDFETFLETAPSTSQRPRTCSIEDKLLRLRLQSAHSASGTPKNPVTPSTPVQRRLKPPNPSSSPMRRASSSRPPSTSTAPATPAAQLAAALAALQAANAAGRRDLDWVRQQAALEECTALTNTHPDVVAPHIKALVLAAAPAVVALRSQTVRHALALLSALLAAFPRSMEAEAEAVVDVLLRRAGEGGHGRESFLGKEADAVLASLCEGVPGTARVAAALLGHAAHKHAGVRGRVAVHLAAMVEAKGMSAVAPGLAAQARLLAAGVGFAEEGAPETRRAGRALLQGLGRHVGGGWGPLLAGLGETQQRRATRLLGTLQLS